MAKFTRFDPDNKKNGRNKDRSLNKDIRIRGFESKWAITDEMVDYEVVMEEVSEDDR
tara:strand:- start:1351 stop:1521 length:171 start_codon:yes stop_codon:yes gene_type:complete